jgi:HK97 gp10 family phage protein
MSLSLKFKTRTNLSTEIILGKARNVASQIVRKTALDIEAEAKRLAPVDTGRLRNSIQTQMENGALIARIVVGAEYGSYVEFGTPKMKAQPYLTPAVEKNREPFKAAMNQLVRR